MGLLEQQKEKETGIKPPETVVARDDRPAQTPQNQEAVDLTTLEAQLKSAATDPRNMANARKTDPQHTDEDDISGKSDEELGLMKFTEEDYKLAEEVVFKGFAQKEYKFGRNGAFQAVLTTTTTGEELIIDTIISEIADTNGMSQTALQHNMAVVMISLSLQSMNGKEFPDNPRFNLTLLKNAMKKLLEFERDGVIDKYNEQRTAIIKLVKARMGYVKAIPTPVLDVIAKKRGNLETMIVRLLDGGILKNS